MKWISVEERLPEPGVRVLVRHYTRFSGGEYMFVGLCEGHGWWTLPETGWATNNVTHWTPLPDPPDQEAP